MYDTATVDDGSLTTVTASFEMFALPERRILSRHGGGDTVSEAGRSGPGLPLRRFSGNRHDRWKQSWRGHPVADSTHLDKPDSQPAATRQPTGAGTTLCQTCRDIPVDKFLSLGMQPACHFSANSEEAAAEEFYPLDLGYCPQCSLVQVMEPVSERVLFSDDYHHIAGLTGSFRKHLRGLAAELAKLGNSCCGKRRVIEIGSNDGSLLDELGDRGFDALGVDPCGRESSGGRPVVQDYFSSELATRLLSTTGPADVVVVLNTLAHVTNLRDFLSGIRTLLADDGVFVSESQYLPDLLDSLQYDFAYHEHSRYYSLTALEAAFRSHGLKIHDVQRIDTHGGSIRVYAGLDGAHQTQDSVTALRSYEETLGLTGKDCYAAFAARVVNHRDGLRRLLKEIANNGSRVAGASFPARATTLLNYCMLGPDEIEFVSEISQVKIGRLSPGTHIPVVPQSKLCGPDQPDYVLLLSWHISEELTSRLRNEGFTGKFIVPLPEPRVID
jgi:SAM-dependent methyltransferase